MSDIQRSLKPEMKYLWSTLGNSIINDSICFAENQTNEKKELINCEAHTITIHNINKRNFRI